MSTLFLALNAMMNFNISMLEGVRYLGRRLRRQWERKGTTQIRE